MDVPDMASAAGVDPTPGADSLGDGQGPGMLPVMGAGAGFMLAGGTMGTIASLMTPIPAAAPDITTVRKRLEEYKRLLDDGLITQDDYNGLKSRILGLSTE